MITRAGAPVSIGASPGNASIDADTGLVTFVADASQALSSITTGASTTLTFSDSVGMYAAMSVGQLVFVSGVSGSAAALINGMSHVVTSKSGSSIVVSTNTTGKSGTGGTAFKYPQPSESMAWSGRFYVPVNFATDEFDWNLVAGGLDASRLYIGPSLQLDEILE